MTKTKSTKRALLLSALSLLMCVSMLIGSTFAWFTDSVTSAGNKIQAGTLQIDLELLEKNGTWTSIKNSNKAIFDYDNWEPGYTDVKILRVSNKGTLALKWLAKFVSNYELSALADVIDVYVKPSTTAFSYADDRTDLDSNGWTNVGSVAKFVNTISATTKGTLEAEEVAYLGIALKMQETADNTYQGMDLGGTFDIQIIATQYTSEEDSFDKNYDMNAAIYVDSQIAAQAALDNAKKGDVIVLAPGNYGTLYMRPTTNTNVTKVVDWQGNNYGWETYSLFEDITILGTTGAVVDAIDIEGLTTYNNNNAHSQGSTHPTMLSLVELKNVVIDGVTFTGNGGQYGDAHGNAISLAGGNIKVDGLTLKNCVLKDSTNNNRLLYKSESTTQVHTYTYGGETFTFSPSLEDITVTGCTFNGGYMGLELRETKNVTITNNVFNVADRNILLTVNSGCAYSGNITITGNVSNNAKERFVRASGTGDAVVVIKNNTLNAYMGADADYIKVTNGNNVTIADNTITYGSTAAAQAAINAAEKDDTLNLLNGTYGNLVIDYSEAAITEGTGQGSAPYKTVRDLGNFTVAGSGNGTVVNKLGFNSYHLTYFEGRGANMEGNEGGAHVTTDSGYKFDTLTIKDLTLKGQFATSDARVTAEKIVFENVTFDCAGWVHLSPANNRIGEVVFKNCKFVNGGSAEQGVHLVAYNQNITTEYTFEGCTFEGAKRQIMVTSYDGGKQCGTITITGCTFKNTDGERAIRMANILNGTVNVTNNTFVNAADSDDQIMKIDYSNSTVTFTGNTTGDQPSTYTDSGSSVIAQ